MYSGASGAVVWTWTGPSSGNEAGSRLVRTGDIDGDGVEELLVSGEGTPVGEGYCAVLSGRTGVLIREHYAAAVVSAPDEFGECMLGIPDVDGDGVPDYLVSDPRSGLPTFSRPGSVSCFSGATGAQVWQAHGVAGNAGFGRAMAVLADWTGDQVMDIAVGASNSGTGTAHVLNAVSGVMVGALPVPPGVQYSFGASIASGLDWDGDGVSEVLVGSNSELHLLDALTGANQWRISVDFPMAIEVIGDMDQDGVADIALGVRDPAGETRVDVLSGIDGGLVRSFDNPTPDAQIGASGIAAFDRDGDSIPELVLGALDWGISLNGREGGIQVHRYSPFLYSRQTECSATQGGALVFDLDFPDSEAGRRYVVLASAAGTGPTSLGGALVPLAPGPLLTLTAQAAPPLPLSGLRGTLDSEGQAIAYASLPAGTLNPLVGSTLHFCALSVDLGIPQAVSVAVPVEILP